MKKKPAIKKAEKVSKLKKPAIKKAEKVSKIKKPAEKVSKLTTKRPSWRLTTERPTKRPKKAHVLWSDLKRYSALQMNETDIIIFDYKMYEIIYQTQSEEDAIKYIFKLNLKKIK